MKIIIAVLLMAISIAAQAFQPAVELKGGITMFNYGHDCSTWYQCGPDKPHTLNMVSPTFGAGLTDAFKVVGQDFRWHGGIDYLGRVSSTAVASTGPDFAPGYPLAHFNGSGYVWGFYGSVEWLKEWQGITWGFGAGGILFRPTWKEIIPDWAGAIGDPQQNITVTHNNRWQNSPTLSISATKGKHSLVFTYEHHITADGDQVPALYDINRSSKLGKAGFPGGLGIEYVYTFK